MPSREHNGQQRGYLIPIGGAEDRLDKPVILERFVDLCGGRDARIVVIPTASRLKDTGWRYIELFDELGAGDAESIPLTARSDAERERNLEPLREATGIFLTGGNQLRLSTILGGTKVAQLIRRRNASGAHVAGTSAGAAILPEHMIGGGRSGATPRPDMVTLAPGLGLTNSVVIDQHFRQRDRLGRLLTAVSYNPFLIGLGLDEDTAAFIAPDGEMEVVGSGAVTVIDPGGLEYSSMSSARPREPVTLIGLKLHILAAGARFNVATREASVEEVSSR